MSVRLLCCRVTHTPYIVFWEGIFICSSPLQDGKLWFLWSTAEYVHKLFGIFDGSFYVSLLLGYYVQLFGQTLVYALLWEYFVEVISIYNQLTLSRLPFMMGVGLTQLVEDRKPRFIRIKEILLQYSNIKILLSLQSSVMSYRFWTCHSLIWRRKWKPTPVFLPGESHGWRSLVGCSPWGCTELDMTEAT